VIERPTLHKITAIAFEWKGTNEMKDRHQGRRVAEPYDEWKGSDWLAESKNIEAQLHVPAPIGRSTAQR
jgi:hypothetical protein